MSKPSSPVRSPADARPRSHVDQPLPARRERRGTLAIEVSNADPTGQISVAIEPVGPGSARFETGSSVEPPVAVDGNRVPEFVTVDPDELQVSVGAPRALGEPFDFSLLVPVRGDASAIMLSLVAAPGTAVSATLGRGRGRSLDSGIAILPI